MKIGLKIAMFAATGLLLAACGSQDKQIVEPDVFSKADFANRVLNKGRLDFDAEAKDSFSQDLEFHSYTVYAATGSVISLEVTHSGTARDLDTTLFVYGPEIGFDLGDRLAHDDDSGWGTHSKISGLTVPRTGNYTVVIGTADGMGRGHYRLTLSCQSTDCIPEDTPVVITEVDPPDALEDLLADAEMPSYAYTNLTAFKWSGYHETPQYDQIRAPVSEWWLEAYEWEGDLPWEDEDEISRGQFDGELFEYGLELDDFEDAAGLGIYDYRILLAHYQFTCYMGVTCWETLYMLLSESSDDLYVLTLGAGEE